MPRSTRSYVALLVLALAGPALAQTAKEQATVPAAPDPAANRDPYTPTPPFRIRDGLTFGSGPDGWTRLVDVEGPDPEAVCFDRKGYLWACGLQARAALNNLIRAAPVTCTPVDVEGTTTFARCTIGGADLGRRLVELGFARPSDGSDPPEMAAARRREAGLWRGGWRLRPPTP